MNDQLPSGLEKHFETVVFTEDSLPEKITEQHLVKEGVWARIVVLQGELGYIAGGSPEPVVLSPGVDGIIRPREPHRVATVGPVQFKIEFYRPKKASAPNPKLA